jgi:hypothetical protein
MWKTKFLSILLVLILFQPLTVGAAYADPVVKTYEIYLQLVSTTQTSVDPSLFTTQIAQQAVDEVDKAYNNLSRGKIRFVFRKILPAVPAASNDNSVLDSLTSVANKIVTTPGFQGALIVGATPPTTLLDGRAFFSGTPFNMIQTLPDQIIMLNGSSLGLGVLVHEIGHALGLFHASTANCNSSALSTNCLLDEYGDPSDVMGAGSLRMSATNLDRLGILETSESHIISSEGQYHIAPAYSSDLTSPKVLYFGGASGKEYSIEYRPAIGVDGPLGDNSSGIQVRILDFSDPNLPKPLLPSIGNFGSDLCKRCQVGNALLRNPTNGNLSYHAGEKITLPDATKIEVLSEDVVTGASIRVSGSADSEPRFHILEDKYGFYPDYSEGFCSFQNCLEYGGSGLGTNATDVLPDAKGQYQSKFNLGLTLSAITNPLNMKNIQLEVDGKIVTTLSYEELTKNLVFNHNNAFLPIQGAAIMYAPGGFGGHKIRILLNSNDGNVNSSDFYDVELRPTEGYPEHEYPAPKITQLKSVDPTSHTVTFLIQDLSNLDPDFQLLAVNGVRKTEDSRISITKTGKGTALLRVSKVTNESQPYGNIAAVYRVPGTNDVVNMQNSTGFFEVNVYYPQKKISKSKNAKAPSANKTIRIVCTKGILTKIVTSVKPSCPLGYVKK